MEEDKNTFTIFSQYLAGKLMCQGFVLCGIGANANQSGKNVFFFKDSPELQKAIGKFSEKRKHDRH